MAAAKANMDDASQQQMAREICGLQQHQQLVFLQAGF
jgi:hypothetical protein